MEIVLQQGEAPVDMTVESVDAGIHEVLLPEAEDDLEIIDLGPSDVDEEVCYGFPMYYDLLTRINFSSKPTCFVWETKPS